MWELVLETFWKDGRATERVYDARPCVVQTDYSLKCEEAIPLAPMSSIILCELHRTKAIADLNNTLRAFGPSYSVKGFKLSCRKAVELVG